MVKMVNQHSLLSIPMPCILLMLKILRTEKIKRIITDNQCGVQLSIIQTRTYLGIGQLIHVTLENSFDNVFFDLKTIV